MSGSVDRAFRVTSALVRAIEAGAPQWRMPWHHDGAGSSRPVNVTTRRPYRGVNTISLWAAAAAAGYGSGYWAGYRQWSALGGRIRKGERAATVIVWKPRTAPDANGSAELSRERLFARGYAVFNADQVDGASLPTPAAALEEAPRIARAEDFFWRLGVPLRHEGLTAFYTPARDEITLPAPGRFRDALAYYGVLFHEAVHATGAPGRCDRSLAAAFGSQAYALEELCAELGAALVLADLDLAVEPRPDHAAYLASWLEVLRAEPRALFRIAAAAQAAVDWMHARQTLPGPPGPRGSPGARERQAMSRSYSASGTP